MKTRNLMQSVVTHDQHLEWTSHRRSKVKKKIEKKWRKSGKGGAETPLTPHAALQNGFGTPVASTTATEKRPSSLFGHLSAFSSTLRGYVPGIGSPTTPNGGGNGNETPVRTNHQENGGGESDFFGDLFANEDGTDDNARVSVRGILSAFKIFGAEDDSGVPNDTVRTDSGMTDYASATDLEPRNDPSFQPIESLKSENRVEMVELKVDQRHPPPPSQAGGLASINEFETLSEDEAWDRLITHLEEPVEHDTIRGLSAIERFEALVILRAKIWKRTFILPFHTRQVTWAIIGIWSLACAFCVLYFGLLFDIQYSQENEYREERENAINSANAYLEWNSTLNETRREILFDQYGAQWVVDQNDFGLIGDDRGYCPEISFGLEWQLNENLTQFQLDSFMASAPLHSLENYDEPDSFGGQKMPSTTRWVLSIFVSYILSLFLWQPIGIYLYTWIMIWWHDPFAITEAYFFAHGDFVAREEFSEKEMKELEKMGYAPPHLHGIRGSTRDSSYFSD